MIATALAVALGGFVFHVWRLVRLIQRRRSFRLGFNGERAVAEELNRLMLGGCRIFHDVPMDPYGNIDHVIVAPNGVYAVETKARRKRKAPAGKRDHEVIFDGKLLHFPHRTDTRPLEQAKHQAERLKASLTKAVGEPVGVGTILTFPGWMVTTRARSDIRVLNPKNIRSAIRSSGSPLLSPQLRERLAYQLDQRWRDVVF